MDNKTERSKFSSISEVVKKQYNIVITIMNIIWYIILINTNMLILLINCVLRPHPVHESLHSKLHVMFPH